MATKQAIAEKLKELTFGKEPKEFVRNLTKAIKDPKTSEAWRGEFTKRVSQVRKLMAASGGAAKGAASIGALGTIGAGAAVVGAWAYPAKKLGEYLGKKSIEQDWEGKIKRVGKRLKPLDIDVKSAATGLSELKSKEGFNKLPFEKQRQLINDYIKKIPFTK